MTISSIAVLAPPPPIKPPEANEPKPPQVKNDDDTARPTVQAALPPGQGTRVDQLA